MTEESAVNETKDWHSSKQIGKRARHLLDHPDEEIPSDVTFLVGDGKDEPQKMFKCHKFILAMVSSMFQAMFYGSVAQEDIIKVPGVTPTAFHLMLRYAYGENVESDDMKCCEIALDTLYCAKKYLVTKLARACRDYIQLQLAGFGEDPCVVLQRAPQLDEDDLASLALVEIAQDTPDVMEGHDFLRLSFECVKQIVDYSYLDAAETDIYQGVIRWVVHNVGAVTGGALRDALGSLLFSIRFPLFTATQLADGPATDNVLTGDEVSSIYKFLFAKVKPALPFLTQPRTALPAAFYCNFDLVTESSSAVGGTFLNGICATFLYARPDLAPACCALLRQLITSKLHIRMASLDNEHVGKTVALPAGLVEERSILSYSIKGACWFEWDMEEGAACNVRIGVGGKPHLYHSAVFGFVMALSTTWTYMPFNSWDDKRIQGVSNFRVV